MNKIKTLVIAGILLSTVFFAPSVSLAQSSEELQKMIDNLMQQIKTLQAQLNSQQSDSTTAAAWCHTFNVNLVLGSTGSEVSALQSALQKEGLFSGVFGDYFGFQTKSAVVAFQQKYNIIPASGYVGLITRTKLNKLYGCESIIPVPGNKPPVVNGVTGPTVLNVGEVGTWVVKASDPEQGALSYLVSYGDEVSGEASATSFYRPSGYAQTATFTHTYATAGVFTVTFTVTDAGGLFAKSSVSVKVGGAVPAPSITVISPNGGETWQAGSSHTIRWNVGSDSSIKNVNFGLRDSKDGSGHDLYLGALNTGSITFILPGDYPVGTYFLRVEKTDGTLLDESNGAFTIVAAPTPREINIISPEAGASWAKGTTHSISWTSTGVKWIDIKLMNSNGLVLDIAKGLVATTTSPYSWNIPLSVNSGTDYKIRLDSGDDKIKDSNTFSITGISEAPAITSLSKTEGIVGSEFTISGTNFKASNTVVFAGQPISAPSTNGVSVAVKVPSLVPGVYKVSIKNANGESNQMDFTVKNRALSVISPNGGESWAKGSTYNITWSSFGVSNLDIILRKNGVRVKDIALGFDAKAGTYAWKVPTDLVLGTDYKIRLLSGDGAMVDLSDANFSIVKAAATTENTTMSTSQMAGALASMSAILLDLQKTLGQ